MTPDHIAAIYDALIAGYARLPVPSVTQVSQTTRKDPFKVLVSTIISLRTKDEVTLAASLRVFAEAETPEALAALPDETLEQALYPASFYRNKAKTLKAISRRLIDEFAGQVPANLDTLLSFNGVGRKSANLIMVEGFGVPAVCVDSHVHRICNRLGICTTKTPEATEMALRAALPKEYWIKWNEILVAWGQAVCRPISPRCSECSLAPLCARRGVDTSR